MTNIHETQYKNHTIFNNLNKLSEFYEILSFSVFAYPTLGTQSIVNIDTYIFTSMKGTLESISITLKNGRIGDAWSLLRRYFDSVIINIYTNLYLKNNIDLENLLIEKINGWVNGKIRIPEYRIMSQYIQNDQNLEILKNLTFAHKNIYKEIRDRCNDYSHYNFYKYVLVNDNEIMANNRSEMLNLFNNDVIQIFILNCAYIFRLREHYMASSDYIDFLDVGQEPPKDSQYWVAQYIQEIFEEIISKYRPDIVKYIQENTAMQI